MTGHIHAIFRGGPLDGHAKILDHDVGVVVMRTRFNPPSFWGYDGPTLLGTVATGRYQRGEQTIHGYEFTYVGE